MTQTIGTISRTVLAGAALLLIGYLAIVAIDVVLPLCVSVGLGAGCHG